MFFAEQQNTIFKIQQLVYIGLYYLNSIVTYFYKSVYFFLGGDLSEKNNENGGSMVYDKDNQLSGDLNKVTLRNLYWCKGGKTDQA